MGIEESFACFEDYLDIINRLWPSAGKDRLGRKTYPESETTYSTRRCKQHHQQEMLVKEEAQEAISLSLGSPSYPDTLFAYLGFTDSNRSSADGIEERKRSPSDNWKDPFSNAIPVPSAFSVLISNPMDLLLSSKSISMIQKIKSLAASEDEGVYLPVPQWYFSPYLLKSCIPRYEPLGIESLKNNSKAGVLNNRRNKRSCAPQA
ncbi:short-chain dehydrogenase/reductase SDR [Striga asiatica]|uniref:Short-chain dehydrogenase/reductase SDR n=1 Tax=Striga asiatica TaxID=4170 RepID=A0A5A7Q284_STRAF|nr:short-chain dehydrogenase/reductase SDR [Striga asiatica]